MERSKPGGAQRTAAAPEKHGNLELGETLALAQEGKSMLRPHHVQQLQHTVGNRAVVQAMGMDTAGSASALFPTQAVIQREDEEGESSWLDSATDWVSDTAGGAVEAVSEGAGQAYDAVSSGVGAVGDAAGGAWDAASGAAGEAYDAVSSGVGAVGDAAGGAWDAASGAAGNAWDTTTGAVGNAWDAASGAAGNVWDTASEGVGRVSDMAGGAWDTVSSDVNEIREHPKNLWTKPLRHFGTVRGAEELAEEQSPGASEKLNNAEGYWANVQYLRNMAHQHKVYFQWEKRKYKYKRDLMRLERSYKTTLTTEEYEAEKKRLHEELKTDYDEIYSEELDGNKTIALTIY